MLRYQFKTRSIPGVVVSSDRSALTSFRVNATTYMTAIWCGVIECEKAAALRPWSDPVHLDFTGYKIDDGDWIELLAYEEIWGCYLKGPKPGQGALFALIENGRPILATKRGAF